MHSSENNLEESRSLRRAMRDLVALSTLPAVWTGLGPDGIVRSLADVLLNTLALDFVYVRLTSPAGEGMIEVVRSKYAAEQTAVLRSSLASLLRTGPTQLPAAIPDPCGDGAINLAVTSLGLGGDCGVLISGSGNPDFPTEQDRLLLNVGANQTAIVVQRRRAEEQIREHQEWLRVTLSSIGDAVIATDTEGRVTYLNPVAQQLTGWSEAEAQGRPLEAVFRIVHEQTRQPVESPVAKVLADGRVVGLANHTALIARDGTERAIDDSAAPIKDEQGNLLGVVLIFRDVSQKRQAERALAESEARKVAILQTALDCIITCDEQGRVVDFNPAAQRTFGYEPAEVIGKDLADLIIPPSLRERHREGMARHLATGKEVLLNRRIEMTARRADGTEFPTELAITRIPGPGPARFTAYLRDITDRKMSELALRQSEQRLAAELEATTRLHALSTRLLSADNLTTALQDVLENAIVTVGADFGNIQLYNAQIDALEIVAQKGFQQDFLDYFRSVRMDDGWACAQAMQRGERTIIEDVELDPAFERHRRIAAAAGYRAVQSTPLKTHDGTILGMLSTHFRAPHRVSDRDHRLLDLYARHAADLIERLRFEQALREADRRKDEFLATLSHELRNPLAPIRNAVQIIRAKGSPVPELQWARDVIDRQVQQMTRLVDDLLDLSRISKGKIELRKKRVELATVVNSAVEASRPLIEKWQHELDVRLPAEPIYLEADPTRLSQVLLNLLNNAAKYTEQGGRIGLTAEKENEHVVIRVKDTGIGIPREMLSRIFEMFTQEDRSLERSQGGLGIGLTLVQSLVEMQGGTVEAHSEGPGKGSEFVVRLPVAREVADQGAPGSAGGETAAAPDKCRILVVDDNRDAAGSLAMLLRIMGNEVHTAHDGLEAIAAAGVFRPDVVLLDIGLPKLNGHEAGRRIREQQGKAVVLIALTGWGQEEDRRRSKEAGFDYHMTKPVELDDLQKLLAGLKATR
jgi:PAS domain S-box-containing protein